MNPLPPSALTRPLVQPPAWTPPPPARSTPASIARVGGFRVNGKAVTWKAFEAELQKIEVIKNFFNLFVIMTIIDAALEKFSKIEIDLVINKIPYSKDQKSFLVRFWDSGELQSPKRCVFYVESKITRIIDDLTRLLGLNS